MSKIPISASSGADRTGGMPTSWHAAIRCVPISPLVLAPQMKKVPASTQKARVRTPRASARSGAIAFGGATGDASAGWPQDRRPTSAQVRSG